jgi:uncharacterized oxidoreductase
VAKESDCKSLGEWTGASFKDLNILVNNAGVQRDIDFTKGADAFLAGESEVRINLEAPGRGYDAFTLPATFAKSARA